MVGKWYGAIAPYGYVSAIGSSRISRRDGFVSRRVFTNAQDKIKVGGGIEGGQEEIIEVER